MTERSSNSIFNFKKFSVRNEKSALKVGTDAVLLGSAMTVAGTDRRMLDIGTGTGVIALMAAQRASEMGIGCAIEAIDIDEESCREAQYNFSASPWGEMVSVFNTPLSSFRAGEPFDLIFSNPPYYDCSLRNPDERECLARHTDTLSYREICSFASENLTGSGRLSLILPSESEQALVRTAASFGLYPFRILRVRTTATKPVKRIVVEFSRSRKDCVEEEIVLQDGNGRTADYASLTEKFYL